MMRVRNQAGMTQRFWRVLGLGPGLPGLQSRLLRRCSSATEPTGVCRIIGHVVITRGDLVDSPIPDHSDRNPAGRRTQERPGQCSLPHHCARAVQSRRHSSVAAVPTPSRSHGRAPLSRLQPGLLLPHRHPRQVFLVCVRGNKQR